MSHSSPVREILDQKVIVLAGQSGENAETGNWQNTETVFYLNYYIESKTLGIFVHDFGTNQDYLPAAQYSDYASAAEALKKLMLAFPGRLDEEIMPSVKMYFDGLKDSLALSGEIILAPDACEHCNGYNFDDYKFVYFPAVPGTLLEKSSLELTWSYGCYREDTVEGAFEEVAPSIINMLKEILDYADPEPRKDIQKVLDTIRSMA